MTVLFLGLFPLHPLHFATELELAEEHLAKGDKVIFLTCDAQLQACEPNPNRELALCAQCIGQRQAWTDGIAGRVEFAPVINNRDEVPDLIPQDLVDVEVLKSLKRDGFDYGEAIYSSLVDRCMSTHPDLIGERAMVLKMAADSWRIWKQALRLIADHAIGTAYIFNGRFNTTRPWVRACQKTGVPFFTHERSMGRGRVFVIPDALPHDPRHHLGRIRAFLDEKWGDPALLREAKDFFEERPRGKRCGLASFVAGQEDGCMPPSWNPARRNFAIFASTEREFVGVKQFTPQWIYPSQIDAYLDLARVAAEKDPTICLYLRVHPNSVREKVRWWEDKSFAELPNLEVIKPEDKISSYALLASVEKVFAYRGSLGMEATYWGKPSIVLTWAFYAGLDAVYEPQDREEVHAFLLAQLEPKPKENIMKYAAFLRCGGRKIGRLAASAEDGEALYNGCDPHFPPELVKWLGHRFHRPKVTGLPALIRAVADYVKFHSIRIKYGGRFAARAVTSS
jgi:hypothetical protein